MFHIHIMGCIPMLTGYGSEYSCKLMGKWFMQYSRNMRIIITFANHPGWDLS